MSINPFYGDALTYDAYRDGYVDRQGTFYDRSAYDFETQARGMAAVQRLDALRNSMYYIPPSPTVPLKERRQTRWRKRMLRMREKVWDRRKMKLANAAYHIGVLWATFLTIAVTAYLLKWLVWLALG